MADIACLGEQIAWKDSLLLTFCQFYALGIPYNGKSCFNSCKHTACSRMWI